MRGSNAGSTPARSFYMGDVMKVVILQCMAGTDIVRNVGEVHEIEDTEAQRFIEAGACELFADETPVAGGPQSAEGGPLKVVRKRK